MSRVLLENNPIFDPVIEKGLPATLRGSHPGGQLPASRRRTAVLVHDASRRYRYLASDEYGGEERTYVLHLQHLGERNHLQDGW
jgi:hypothetical protein